jgi:hypothetical protein
MSLFWVIANGIKSKSEFITIYISIIRVEELEPDSLFIASRHVDRQSDAFKFSDHSQEVLVHGLIPRAALVATVPLTHLLDGAPPWLSPEKLPGYIYDGHYQNQACWKYADAWVNSFQEQTKAERSPSRHSTRMIQWAYDMLSHEEGVAIDINGPDVAQLSLYLYRWPFRGRPGGVGTAAPSIKACKKIIRDAVHSMSCVISWSICVHAADRASRLPSAEDEDGTSEEDSDSEDDLAGQLERMTVSQSVT